MPNEILDIVLPWLLTVALIALGGFILNKVLQKLIAKAVRIAIVPDGTPNRDAERQREDTLISIFGAATRVSIIVITALTILKESGIDIAPILAGVGIVGIALGFGGQYLIRDIITGLFVIIENQYRIGDSVRIDTVSGLVEKISVRMTTLREIDGIVHHIPHGEIKIVSNLSKNFARVNLNIGVAYDTDIDKVIEVINETGMELSQDPAFSESIIKAPQFLRVDHFGDSSIDLKILGETMPLKQWEITGELRKRLKKAFDKHGIEIPFPQRVMHQAK